jgi:hypothetical protein
MCGGDRFQLSKPVPVDSPYGLDAVATACKLAISDKTVSGDVILSILSRTHDEPLPEPVNLSAHLPVIKLIPVVDCSRYDVLLSGGIYGTA